MRSFSKPKKGQSLIELGIFSVLIIFVMTVLVNIGMNASKRQKMMMQVQRKAWQLADQVQDTYLNAYIEMEYDEPVPDVSNIFGIPKRADIRVGGSASRSNFLLTEMDKDAKDAELPRVVYDINGKVYNLKTGEFAFKQYIDSDFVKRKANKEDWNGEGACWEWKYPDKKNPYTSGSSWDVDNDEGEELVIDKKVSPWAVNKFYKKKGLPNPYKDEMIRNFYGDNDAEMELPYVFNGNSNNPAAAPSLGYTYTGNYGYYTAASAEVSEPESQDPPETIAGAVYIGEKKLSPYAIGEVPLYLTTENDYVHVVATADDQPAPADFLMIAETVQGKTYVKACKNIIILPASQLPPKDPDAKNPQEGYENLYPGFLLVTVVGVNGENNYVYIRFIGDVVYRTLVMDLQEAELDMSEERPGFENGLLVRRENVETDKSSLVNTQNAGASGKASYSTVTNIDNEEIISRWIRLNPREGVNFSGLEAQVKANNANCYGKGGACGDDERDEIITEAVAGGKQLSKYLIVRTKFSRKEQAYVWAAQ